MSGQSRSDTDRYEVVVGGDDGVEKEHAELLKRQLVNDGFHDHAVSVRPIESYTNHLEVTNEDDLDE